MWQEFYTMSRDLGQKLGHLILPPVCASCHVPVLNPYQLCADCWRDIEFFVDPLCPVTGAPLPFAMGEKVEAENRWALDRFFDQARVVGRYQGTLKRLVQRLKFQDRNDVVPLLAMFLEQSGGELCRQSDLVMPVPLHAKRLRQRRFNQSAELARALVRNLSPPQPSLVLDLVVRHKPTLPQVGLSAAERCKNIAGAFSVNDNYHAHIRDAHVLIVDDVMTTGATVNQIAKQLKANGAKSVKVLCVAGSP